MDGAFFPTRSVIVRRANGPPRQSGPKRFNLPPPPDMESGGFFFGPAAA